MKFPPWLKVYGDVSYCGSCPTETAEQSTFFNQLPTDLKKIALHIRNEGKRDFRQMAKQKAEGGFISGASDVVIPGCPTFVCEMKRADHTKSKWQPGQIDYLDACQDAGCFVAVALGWEAAMDAVMEWKSKGQ